MEGNNIKKGVSVIIFDKRGSMHYFLVLNRKKEWVGWEFPKGIIMPNETSEQAVLRVIKEETGLKKYEIKGILSKKREFVKEGEIHSFDTYLVEANMNVTVDLSRNDAHSNYFWGNKDRILEKLHWPDEKNFFIELIGVLNK